MPDPGDAELARIHFGKKRAGAVAGTLGEKRRDQHLGEEVAFPPIAARPQSDAGGTFIGGRVIRGSLANNVSPAFFGKGNRHFGRTIWSDRSDAKLFGRMRATAMAARGIVLATE